MTRLSIVLFLSALSAPLAAHEGLEIDSPLHNFLHSLATDNAISVCAIGLIIGLGVLFRRRMRARSIQPDAFGTLTLCRAQSHDAFPP